MCQSDGVVTPTVQNLTSSCNAGIRRLGPQNGGIKSLHCIALTFSIQQRGLKIPGDLEKKCPELFASIDVNLLVRNQSKPRSIPSIFAATPPES